MTPQGQITLYSTQDNIGSVTDMTPLADGTVWFLNNDDSIGVMRPDGDMSVFPIPNSGSLQEFGTIATLPSTGDDAWLVVTRFQARRPVRRIPRTVGRE